MLSSTPPTTNGELSSSILNHSVGLYSYGPLDSSSGIAFPSPNNANTNTNINNINTSSNNSVKVSSTSDGDLLYEETKKGTRELSLIIDFMKKRVKIEEDYARSLLQLCKSFPLGSNGSAIGESFSNLLECTAKQAGSYLTAASQITAEVNNPLKQFLEDLKAELKGVQQETQKLTLEKREVLESFKRSKANFESACKEADTDAKIEQLEQDYKAHISHTNTYLQVNYSEKFQKMAMELQKTEILRMHKMKVSLKRFVNLLEEDPQTVSDFLQLSERINLIDSKEEIKNFSSLIKSLDRSEEEIVFEPYERVQKPRKEWRITMSKRTTSLNNLGSIGAKPMASTPPDEKKIISPRSPHNKDYIPPPTAVFGVPMEVVMERQKAKHPDMLVPHVVVCLIHLIKHLNGFKTEGIFRVPGVARETEAMKRAFDESEEVEAKTFPNVHTAASALKLWLRELPNSIVPEDMYYMCLATESDDAAFACVDSFPTLNRRVLLVFLQFFKELLLEEHVAKTRMDVENISIVFTPSFMRCSTVPQTSLLDNVDKERSFIHRLISSCDILLAKYNLTLQEIPQPKEIPQPRENKRQSFLLRDNHLPRESQLPARQSPPLSPPSPQMGLRTSRENQGTWKESAEIPKEGLGLSKEILRENQGTGRMSPIVTTRESPGIGRERHGTGRESPIVTPKDSPGIGRERQGTGRESPVTTGEGTRESPVNTRESQIVREGSWKSVRIPSPTSSANPARPQLSPHTRMASQKFQQQQQPPPNN
eukprot:Phypoly_transcript_01993.p1 GENE.Phypoly_transcript_01993~~Phypoly_transcript_01993.p1  ORF type:complete len:766 (+),score=95.14 Phypoly_transcript_01993:705-3002(+)